MGGIERGESGVSLASIVKIAAFLREQVSVALAVFDRPDSDRHGPP